MNNPIEYLNIPPIRLRSTEYSSTEYLSVYTGTVGGRVRICFRVVEESRGGGEKAFEDFAVGGGAWEDYLVSEGVGVDYGEGVRWRGEDFGNGGFAGGDAAG